MLDRSPPVSVPRLQTSRLRLREYRRDDFAAYAAHLADPPSMALFGTHSRRDAWRMFGGNMGGWVLDGAGWWAIELRASGAVVGNVGAFFREAGGDLELGWNTFRAYWGQGIASEAAAAVVRYAFDVRGEPRVIALIDAANPASQKVAAHVGMTYEAETELFGNPIGRYALSR